MTDLEKAVSNKKRKMSEITVNIFEALYRKTIYDEMIIIKNGQLTIQQLIDDSIKLHFKGNKFQILFF
jgi:hypothetical protein